MTLPESLIIDSKGVRRCQQWWENSKSVNVKTNWTGQNMCYTDHSSDSSVMKYNCMSKTAQENWYCMNLSRIQARLAPIQYFIEFCFLITSPLFKDESLLPETLGPYSEFKPSGFYTICLELNIVLDQIYHLLQSVSWGTFIFFLFINWIDEKMSSHLKNRRSVLTF